MLNQVNEKIRQIINADEKFAPPYLAECSRHNGKKIRARLLLLCSRYFGACSDAVKLAAIIEIIHFASLLHDDVIDNADLRRGKNSFNKTWGNKVSILLADYLLSKALGALSGKKYAEILNIIFKTIKEMSRGQLNEINNLGNVKITFDDYINVVKQKTASLFSASCRIGAFLSKKANPKDILVMEKFGENFGILFQITDDMLDIWGAKKKLGKPKFSDLRQKNFTLPLILLLRDIKGKDKVKLISFLNSEIIDNKQIKEILRFLDKYEIREKTLNAAKIYREKALFLLDQLPQNKAKNDLKNIIVFP